METLVIPEGVEQLSGYGTFGFCGKLREVILPKSISSISTQAFIGATNIEDVVLHENNPYFVFENGTLMDKNKTSMKILTKAATNGGTFTIPEGMQSLGEGTLSSNRQIKKLVLCKSLRDIAGNAVGNALTSIDINGNPYFTISNNCLYDSTKESLFICFSKEQVINIEEGTKTIKFRAFTPAVNSTTLNLPDSLETLSSYAITRTYKNLRLGKNFKNFSADSVMASQNGIEIDPENPKYKAENGMIYSKDGTLLIRNMIYGQKIIIPEGVKRIEGNAFQNSSNIESIIIPNSVTTIGNDVFRGTNLKKIEIPESVTSMSSTAFAGCADLKEIVINNKPGSIPGSPWGCVIGERAIKWLK